MRTLLKQDSGFTLVEMIVVIVITGIIGGIVAVFLRAPVQGYVDSARRAELTDIADTAMRRMARDVRTAVPNSVRVTACPGTCVEFLPTKDGGRYRASATGGSGGCLGNGDALVFSPAGADTCFEVIGTLIPFLAASVDYMVVGSTQWSAAPPYDTTANGVLRKITGFGHVGAVQWISMTGASVLPAWAELPSHRFDVVDGTQQAVTYACENLGTDSGGNGTGQLRRYWHYGFYTAQPTPPINAQAPEPPNPGAVQSAILADRVSACAIDYDLTNQRFGLLAVRLTLTNGGESVSLYNEIHVNNAP